MSAYSVFINDAVADASPVLRRMRLDGLDRATVPFAERYVLAWLGSPRSSMGLETMVHVIKVWLVTIPRGNLLTPPSWYSNDA